MLTDSHNIASSAGLREIAVALADNGIKVVPVVIGGRTQFNRIRPLVTLDDYIVSVGSADRLSGAVQLTVEKILRGWL